MRLDPHEDRNSFYVSFSSLRRRGIRALACALLVFCVAVLSAEGATASGGVQALLVPGQVLVKFRAGTSLSDAQQSLTRAGVVGAGVVPGIGVTIARAPAGLEEQALGVLRADTLVAYAERDVFVSATDTTPSDPLWTSQTGPQDIAAPRAWDVAQGSPATVVAVLDTGVDASHPDLAGSTIPGHDFMNGDADPSDDNGHGTAVAGVIAARTNNGAGLAGVCWHCTILPVKVIDVLGNGTTATLATGITWAAGQGADVINMSLAGPASTQALADAVSYAAAKGIVLVASAGNDATTQKMYPAALPSVVSVAATTPAHTLYPFSNRGEDWVGLAAPGCNTSSFLLGTYVSFCGTSSSAPLVSGVAALALSLRPDAGRSAVVQALEQAASPIAEAGVRYGEVNAYGTLVALTNLLGSQVSPPAAPSTVAPPGNADTAVTTVAPRVLRRPSVSGLARVGRRLTARKGAWSGSTPIAFRYRWLRCRFRTGGCRPIPRAAGARYRIVRRDLGLRIRVVVTATNVAGAAVRISKPSARVRRAL